MSNLHFCAHPAGVLGAVNTAGTVVTGVGGLATATVGSVLGVSGAAVARVGAGALSAWEVHSIHTRVHSLAV